ncbi:hypothetical protein EDB87DRAFT_1629156 [Lactarius vividus]|nr:hypothetical protein EDB87DRAFT_1629156 [Lactarius vividus]
MTCTLFLRFVFLCALISYIVFREHLHLLSLGATTWCGAKGLDCHVTQKENVVVISPWRYVAAVKNALGSTHG